MLSQICDGSLESSFILFIDRAECKGDKLFQAVLKSFIESCAHIVHVFCWRAGTWTFFQNIGISQKHLKLHDCSDCSGWINHGNKIKNLQDLIQGAQSTKEVSIVIDSLSMMLMTLGFGQCMRDLQTFQRPLSGINAQQILCLVHADVLPGGQNTLSFLKHLCSTSVTVLSNEVQITHQKPGGHVKRKNEKFVISAGGKLIITACDANLTCPSTEEKPALLPEDVASFRVRLNDKERSDKSRLVLPYTRTLDEGGGKVFYQPDSLDDWDDEDPDDDLDI